jgi:hypothetical protein
MTHAPPGARQIERRSLQIGVAANLVMAVMGLAFTCPRALKRFCSMACIPA